MGAGEWAKRGERWIRVKRGEGKKMRRDIKQELRGQDKEDEEVEIHRTNTGDRHCNGEKEEKKNTKKNERMSGSFINHAHIQAAALRASFFFSVAPL